MEDKKMSIGKGIVITIAVVLVIAIMVVAMNMLKIPMWIVFMGLTSWSALGMSFQIKDISKVWVSAFIALVIGYLLNNSGTLGMWALAVAAVGLLLMIFGMVSGRLSFLFNSYTAIFLTTCTASGIELEPKSSALSLLFGFLVIGILPWLLVSALQKKQKQTQTQ
jgi:hypothetical protein